MLDSRLPDGIRLVQNGNGGLGLAYNPDRWGIHPLGDGRSVVTNLLTRATELVIPYDSRPDAAKPAIWCHCGQHAITIEHPA